jgi:glycosyltransferase involved in cell wall biosynthesis
LRALSLLRDALNRDDVHCILMGAGDAYHEMVALSGQLGIEDMVEFVGWVGDDYIRRCLSTADVCLSPDPANPFNNKSTMIKVAEYMAMGRPVVSFDLAETRVSAGDAAVYVPANDELAFAGAIDTLLRNPDLRRKMGDAGSRKIVQELSWEASSRVLVTFYEGLLNDAQPRSPSRRSRIIARRPCE